MPFPHRQGRRLTDAEMKARFARIKAGLPGFERTCQGLTRQNVSCKIAVAAGRAYCARHWRQGPTPFAPPIAQPAEAPEAA
jgi:hypothetical protein